MDALKATGKDVIVFDDELPGFGLRVKPNGARSFLIQYRQGGRTRRLTLGRYGRLTAEEGRKLARQHLAAVGRGGDPSEDRHRANQAPRKSEILTLRWDDVDLERGALHLPDSKTGPKSVPLGAAAAEILAGIPRVAGNPYVFPGEKEGSHWVNVERSWRRLRKAAGLPEVRLHDLRHSYAAVGAAAGLGLPIIGKILGHTQPSTTQRYIHFADDPLRAAADRIASEIAAAMRGGPAGEVIPFRPSGN